MRSAPFGGYASWCPSWTGCRRMVLSLAGGQLGRLASSWFSTDCSCTATSCTTCETSRSSSTCPSMSPLAQMAPATAATPTLTIRSCAATSTRNAPISRAARQPHAPTSWSTTQTATTQRSGPTDSRWVIRRQPVQGFIAPCKIPPGTGLDQTLSRYSASPTGRANAIRWPPGNTSASTRRRSRARVR